ncbi:MAG: hypothetical protein JXX28_11135 [Deltaproteobacteria bacterium]|nr:hypothetical protein [Deltaproteobacteria bacterium]
MRFNTSGARPLLLAPGQALPTLDGAGLHWHDGHTLWEQDGDGLIASWGPKERRLEGEGSEPPRAVPGEQTGGRRGPRAAIRREGHRWVAPFPLPDSAADAVALHPFLTGEGVVWEHGGTLYRLGERVSALGSVRPGTRLRVGPEGAVLVGLSRGAPARGGLRRLEVEIGAALRWKPDGSGLVAEIPGGAGEVDLRTGAVVWEREGHLPVSADRATLDPATGRVWRGGALLADGFTGGGAARRGSLLAGPGGTVWDLDRGVALWADPALRDLSAWTPEGWLTCDEDGGALLLDDDGAPLWEGRLPLREGDAVTRVWWRRDRALFLTLDGEVIELLEGRAGRAQRSYRPPLGSLPPGVVEVDGGVEVDGVRYPLAIDGARRCALGVALWSDRGLLVVV